MTLYTKFLKIIRKIYPILQPEWIHTVESNIPKKYQAIFYEEEHYQRMMGKTKIDITYNNYRYIVKADVSAWLIRRKLY